MNTTHNTRTTGGAGKEDLRAGGSSCEDHGAEAGQGGGSGSAGSWGEQKEQGGGSGTAGGGSGSAGSGHGSADSGGDGGDGSAGGYRAVESFEEMGLREDLLHGVYAMGFEKPSAIQQRAILPLIDGRDLVAQGQSGTGKTATFAIGLLQNIDVRDARCQALVVSPTRDLANQTANVVAAIGERMGVQSRAVIGGTSMSDIIRALRRGVHFVVGTPGRVIDMLQRRVLDPTMLRYFVLDEADEMLKGGFEDNVREIFTLIPRDTRVGLFSATMPPEVMELTKRFMAPDAVRILVVREEQTLDGIKQFYVHVGSPDAKFETLCDLYDSLSISQAMIFVNTRRRVEWLKEAMDRADFTVSAIHADMNQADREMIVREFRSGRSRVLVTTDVLARGIDVQQVNLVINYDLCDDVANYVHRIGRSGRFGRKGTAINLLSDTELRGAQEIERYYSTTINELPNDLSTVC